MGPDKSKYISQSVRLCISNTQKKDNYRLHNYFETKCAIDDSCVHIRHKSIHHYVRTLQKRHTYRINAEHIQ